MHQAAQAAFSQDLSAIAGGTFNAGTSQSVFVPRSQLQSHHAEQPVIPAAPKYFRAEFEKGKKEEPSLEQKVDIKDDPFAGQYVQFIRAWPIEERLTSTCLLLHLRYIVKGTIYIEARYHEDKLVRGVRCEVGEHQQGGGSEWSE